MRTPTVVSILLTAGLACGADLSQSPAADLLTHYQALRTVALDAERVATVENFEFQKDAASFLLKSGQLCFLQPVAGRVTGAIFIGDGTFTIKPPSAIEREHMARVNDGKPDLAEPFKAAIFVFSDEKAFDALKPAAQAVPSKAADLLKEFRDFFRDDLSTNVYARVLADMAFPARAMFMADIRGDQHGRLLFSFDPDSREEVELIAYGKSLDYFDQWCEFRPGGAKIEPKDTADITKFHIDTTLDGTKLSGETKMEYTALVDGPRVLPMRLARSLRVSKVVTGDGAELSFIQEDKKKDGELWVILPAPLKKGAQGTLTVTYAGDDVVESAGSGNFYVGARTSWYASIRSGPALSDHALYNMVFRVPKKFQVVATGRKVSEREEGKQTISEWTTGVPFKVAGFNYGKYKTKSMTDGGVEISVYANSGLVDDLAAIKAYADSDRNSGITSGGLTTTGMMDRAMAEAVNSLRLYTKAFGPTPYKSLSITQQPSSSFGQSWPTLVFMPYTALLDNTMRNQLGLMDTASRRFLNEVGPHEIAHQWWGHMIGWSDYHDQWLSEGFAEYSSGFFIHYMQGDKEFKTFINRTRDDILLVHPPNTRPMIEAGPIWLGGRLDTKKFQGAGQLIYSKGAYVLHMLRMMMYDISRKDDGKFVNMVRDFVQTYQGRNATTENFKAICDKHFGQDMSWFFNQWVYGTLVPKVNVQYSLPKRGEDTFLVADISLSGVPDDFEVWVPVVFKTKQGIISGRLRVVGKSHLETKLPVAPDEVEFDPYRSILGEMEVKKL